jgi:hypothetical protein
MTVSAPALAATPKEPMRATPREMRKIRRIDSSREDERRKPPTPAPTSYDQGPALPRPFDRALLRTRTNDRGAKGRGRISRVSLVSMDDDTGRLRGKRAFRAKVKKRATSATEP